MATTGTEKHCRLCLMLNKGGTQACHTLLLKRVEELLPTDHQPDPWTIHEFLQSKKEEILKSNISKDKLQVLFPRSGVTDLSKWDLSLFCTILTIYCDLKQLTRLDVERLRTLRNELCHMNDPDIDDVKYKDYFETIKVVVSRILQGNSDTQQAIEKILNDINEGPLSLVETLKEMHTFYSMEMDVREKLEYVQDDVERVLQKVESFDSKLDQISNKLDPETCSKLHSARNNFLIPEAEVFLDLKDVGTDEQQRISVILEQLFEEVINKDDDFKSTIPADSYTKLREAVRKTFELFLMKGWRINSARHECVRLHIRCLTFKSLAALFREHIQGNINRELTNLNTAVSEILCEKKAQLETVIYKDEFWSVLDKTMFAADKLLTDQDSDTKPTLHEKQQHCDDQKKHALSLTASSVAHEEPQPFEKDCESDLDTCLRLLESELKTEFNAPHVSMQASYTSKRTQKDTDQEGPSDECVTTPKETEAQKDAPLYFPSARTSKTVDQDLSSHEPYSKVQSEISDTLQTIALLELYTSQTAIAQYLELAFLSLNDYPDIAGEICSTSESARDIRLQTFRRSEWFGFILNIRSIFLGHRSPYVGHSVMEPALSLKAQTEKTKKRYTELQDTVRKHIKLFDRITRSDKCDETQTGNQHVTLPLEKITEAERTNAKEKSYEFEKPLSKISEEERFRMTKKGVSSNFESYKLIEDDFIPRELSLKTFESTTKYGFKHDEGKAEPKHFKDQDRRSKTKIDMLTSFEDSSLDRYRHDIEGKLAMLRPGTALTGGLSREGMRYLMKRKHDNIFRLSRHGKEIDIMTKAYKMTQEETGSTTQAFVVQRMVTQHQETLDRLETIRRKEEGDRGIECLREVDRHLTYIDLQLARIIECLSKLMVDLDSLRRAGDSFYFKDLSLYTLESMVEEEWGFVQELFELYVEENNGSVHDLYRFLLRQNRYALSMHRDKRKEELLSEIEVPPTYLSPGSEKSSDQYSDTHDKGKGKTLKGKEEMENKSKCTVI